MINSLVCITVCWEKVVGWKIIVLTQFVASTAYTCLSQQFPLPRSKKEFPEYFYLL